MIFYVSPIRFKNQINVNNFFGLKFRKNLNKSECAPGSKTKLCIFIGRS